MGVLGFIKMLWNSKPAKVPIDEDGWQVCDFDNFMKGNPHDIEGMKEAFGKLPSAPRLPGPSDFDAGKLK